MSEYQYYEFVALDRRLTAAEMAELRALSTRAEITPTSLTNEYHFGSFKGSPEKLMEHYFDAHVYVANWGTNCFMLRLPQTVWNKDACVDYFAGDWFDFEETGKNIILKWEYNEGEGFEEFEGDQGWMAKLIPIREELERGDYRALYLGWLMGVSAEELDLDTIEPPVPPNLGTLSMAQRHLIKFLNIDEDVVAAAAQASVNLKAPAASSASDMARWVMQLPAAQMQHYVLMLLQGNALEAERELRKQFNLANKNGEAVVNEADRRDVATLLALADKMREKRLANEKQAQQRAAIEAQKKRNEYLIQVAKDATDYWDKAQAMANLGNASAYDAATAALKDLWDAHRLQGTESQFRQQLRSFREIHSRRRALMQRLDEQKLGI